MKPQIFKEHLTQQILPYWRDRMVDELNGGFYGRIDGYDQLDKHADKGVILNARILWTFSAAHQLTNDDRDRDMADRAWQYLSKYFVDKTYGGVYWMVDQYGRPCETKKQVYAQAFAIYASAEYHKINPDSDAKGLAIGLYRLLEQHSWDLAREGYLEAHSREWGPIADLRLSEKDLNATKTMNTHLHILEAYTNLYSIWPDRDLRVVLERLIKLMLHRFIGTDHHFKLFFTEDWNIEGDIISYGHDIEGGWLLHEAAEVLGDHDMVESIKVKAVEMTTAALAGLDGDGGLMYEGKGTVIIDREKHWWPQAEALVGCVNAWQITSDEYFLSTASKIWKFIQNQMVDPSGEWYWSRLPDGSINRLDDKAGPWKCPYHNGRAMMEMVKRL